MRYRIYETSSTLATRRDSGSFDGTGEMTLTLGFPGVSWCLLGLWPVWTTDGDGNSVKLYIELVSR